MTSIESSTRPLENATEEKIKEMNADENAEKVDSSGEKGYNKGEEKANKPIFRLNLQLFSNIDIHKQTSNWKRELDLIKGKSKDIRIR